MRLAIWDTAQWPSASCSPPADSHYCWKWLFPRDYHLPCTLSKNSWARIRCPRGCPIFQLPFPTGRKLPSSCPAQAQARPALLKIICFSIISSLNQSTADWDSHLECFFVRNAAQFFVWAWQWVGGSVCGPSSKRSHALRHKKSTPILPSCFSHFRKIV